MRTFWPWNDIFKTAISLLLLLVAYIFIFSKFVPLDNDFLAF